MRKFMSQTHKVLSILIALTVFVQMFLAGLWHSGSVASPDAHVFVGLGLLLTSLLALIASLLARNDSKVSKGAAALFILILLQPIIMEQRRSGIPFISAFHALNAAVIGMVAGTVVRMAQLSAASEEDADLAMAAGD